MNVLVVSAHHDDLELGCGGTVGRLIECGHRVTSLVLCHSGYCDAKGAVVRSREDALLEGRNAAVTLGYDLVSHEEDTFDLSVSDANIRRILDAITGRGIDTVFTHWAGDTHPVHQRVATMVMQACRRVPRVFGFAVNWYVGSAPFHPTTYLALEERHWQRKVRALACYATEYVRTGAGWVDYMDRQTRQHGLQIGVPRAEAFVTIKNLMDVGMCA